MRALRRGPTHPHHVALRPARGLATRIAPLVERKRRHVLKENDLVWVLDKTHRYTRKYGNLLEPVHYDELTIDFFHRPVFSLGTIVRDAVGDQVVVRYGGLGPVSADAWQRRQTIEPSQLIAALQYGPYQKNLLGRPETMEDFFVWNKHKILEPYDEPVIYQSRVVETEELIARKSPNLLPLQPERSVFFVPPELPDRAHCFMEDSLEELNEQLPWALNYVKAAHLLWTLEHEKQDTEPAVEQGNKPPRILPLSPARGLVVKDLFIRGLGSNAIPRWYFAFSPSLVPPLMVTALTKLDRLGAEIARTWPVQPVRRPVEWLCAPPGSEDWRLLNTTEQFDQMRFRELLTNRVCLEIDGHRLHLNEGLPLRALPLPPKAAPPAEQDALSRKDTYALSSDTIAGLSIMAGILIMAFS